MYGPLYLNQPLESAKSLEQVEKSVTTPSNTNATAAVSIQPVQPAQSLDALIEKAKNDDNLKLGASEHSLVFGEGPTDAQIMIIGDIPTQDDVAQRLPFVGAAGQLLTKMLKAISLKREQVYLTTLYKYHVKAAFDLSSSELNYIGSYLTQQIDLVKPSIILCMGSQAASFLHGISMPFERMRTEKLHWRQTPMYVTYPPEQLLQNQSLKRAAWEDLQQFQKHLEGLGIL
jgi:DNA polymerase